MFKDPPAGQRMEYGGSSSSSSSHLGRKPQEATSLGLVEDEDWLQRRNCLREGAEVHRQVRQFLQQKVRPGIQLLEIAEMVEKASSSLVAFDPRNPLRRGWAFPTGLSLNEVAAHDTVNPGDAARYLRPADLLKVDFGVHVEGHILDCAFSMSFDPMHDELMRAVQEATEEGLRQVGHDARICEVSRCIQEVMEAGEVHHPNGKVLPVKASDQEPHRAHDWTIQDPCWKVTPIREHRGSDSHARGRIVGCGNLWLGGWLWLRRPWRKLFSLHEGIERCTNMAKFCVERQSHGFVGIDRQTLRHLGLLSPMGGAGGRAK